MVNSEEKELVTFYEALVSRLRKRKVKEVISVLNSKIEVLEFNIQNTRG